MLGEFAQDSDFVVWSLGIADLGTEGTSERDGAKVKNCIDVGLKTSAIGSDQIFWTLKSGGILKLPARFMYSKWKTM